MSHVYLLATDSRIESPSISEIVERTQDPVFELMFQSESHNASLIVKMQPGIGVAFWYCEHEQLTFDTFHYDAVGTGEDWVSVLPQDRLGIVTSFDGQDYQNVPRMYYVEEDNLEPVLQEFVNTGTRSDCINWEKEEMVVKRLGSKGCFDDIV